MYRRKTVDALLRHHERRENQLLATIREQNDRLMLLAGVQYSPTPLELHHDEEIEPDEEDLALSLSQSADDLGGDVY